MRDFLNTVLASILTTSLTDSEFATVPVDLNFAYNGATYNALSSILKSRDLVSNDLERLTFLFRSKGVVVIDGEAPQAKSNIFVGSVL